MKNLLAIFLIPLLLIGVSAKAQNGAILGMDKKSALEMVQFKGSEIKSQEADKEEWKLKSIATGPLRMNYDRIITVDKATQTVVKLTWVFDTEDAEYIKTFLVHMKANERNPSHFESQLEMADIETDPRDNRRTLIVWQKKSVETPKTIQESASLVAPSASKAF